MYKVLNPGLPADVRPGICALAIMTKAPRAGDVKTRLSPPLTPEQAATLSLCFLRDTAANVARVADSAACESVAIYTPVGSEAMFEGLLPASFSLLPQRGESLSERLIHGVHDLLALGYDSLCMLGSDSPTLPPAMLKTAITALQTGQDCVVLGPAHDGGYYLIGLKKTHPELFTGIDWSTDKVLAQTLERATGIGLPVKLLDHWYDVDDVAALGRLCQELFSPAGVLEGEVAPYEANSTRNYLHHLASLRDEVSGRSACLPSPCKELN